MIIYIVAASRNIKAVKSHKGLFFNLGQTSRSVEKRLKDDDYRRKNSGGEWLVLHQWKVEDSLKDKVFHKLLEDHGVKRTKTANTEEFFARDDDGTAANCAEIIENYINQNSILKLKDKLKNLKALVASQDKKLENYKTSSMQKLACSLGQIRRSLDEREKDFDERKKDFEEREKELVDERKKDFEERKKDFDEREKDLLKYFEEREKELVNEREKGFEEREKELVEVSERFDKLRIATEEEKNLRQACAKHRHLARTRALEENKRWTLSKLVWTLVVSLLVLLVAEAVVLNLFESTRFAACVAEAQQLRHTMRGLGAVAFAGVVLAFHLPD